MNIIFFGTNHVSKVILEDLIKNCRHEVTAVVTQPASESDIRKSPYNHEVFSFLESGGFPKDKVFTPIKAGEPAFIEAMRALEPDLFVVASYGQILKPALLAVPSVGAINIHFSLLPHLRGASPVQWAIAQGEKVSGITFIKMLPGLDDGPILFRKEYPVRPEWTSADALDFLSLESSVIFTQALNDLQDTGSAKKYIESGTPQDATKATFCPLIKKEMGRVDPDTDTPDAVINKFRAFQPWPGIYIERDGRRFKFIKINLTPVQGNFPAGLHSTDRKTLFLGTSTGGVEVMEIQPEGKQPMTGADFIRGYIR